jgi:hypothetical protein
MKGVTLISLALAGIISIVNGGINSSYRGK